MRAWDGQRPFIDFMDEYWHLIEKPVSLLQEHGIDVAVRNMSCSEDCVKVAAAIAKILKDAEDKHNDKASSTKAVSNSSDTAKDDLPQNSSDENNNPEDLGSSKSIKEHIRGKCKHINNCDNNSDENESSDTISSDTENKEEESQSSSSTNPPPKNRLPLTAREKRKKRIQTLYRHHK